MSILSIPARVWDEARAYGVAIRHFNRNARLFLLSNFIFGPGLHMYALLYNLYLLDLGFNEGLVGQVLAASSLGTMAGSLPAGWIYARWGGRINLTLSVIAIVLTKALQLWVYTPALLIIASFLAGFAAAPRVAVVLPFLANEASDRERTHLISLHAITMTVAEVVGALLGGILPVWFIVRWGAASPAEAKVWAMWIGVAFTLISVLPFLAMGAARIREFVVEPDTGSAPAPPQRNMRGFVGGGVIIFFVGLMAGATAPFYNVYFSTFHQASTEQVGLLISLSRIASTVGLFVLPVLAGRIGLVKTNILLGLVTVPFVLVLAVRLPMVLTVPLFLIAFTLVRSNTILYFNLIMEVVSPRERATQGALRVFVNFLAQALAGAIGGWLVVQLGYSALFGLGAAAAIVAAALAWRIFGHSAAAVPQREAHG